MKQVTSKTEITEAVRAWKAQRSAELRMKVRLLQQELRWAIDDLERHQQLQGEDLFYAANNEGVPDDWPEELGEMLGLDWMEEMKAIWTIPKHPPQPADKHAGPLAAPSTETGSRPAAR